MACTRQEETDEESKMPPGMEELFFDFCKAGRDIDTDGADGAFSIILTALASMRSQRRGLSVSVR